MAKPRLLIANVDRLTLVKYLEDRGFVCFTASTGDEIVTLAAELSPDLILIDLLLPGKNAVQILRDLSAKKMLGVGNDQCQVIVISAHSSVNNVQECLSNGATDYIVKPFNNNDLVNRLAFHTQKRREIRELESIKISLESANYHLYLVDLALRQAHSDAPIDEKLFRLTKMLTLALNGVRCSVIKCDLTSNRGHVIFSQDDPEKKVYEIDLNKYPELTTMLTTGKMIVLENLDKNPIMKEIKSRVKSISFNSIIVCPIKIEDKIFGAVSIRMPHQTNTFTDVELRFAQVITHIIGLLLQYKLLTANNT